MTNKTVFLIKTVHLSLFFLMCISLVYAFYAAVVARYDGWLVAAMVMVFIDGLSIVLNKGRCPLTTLAEHYGAADGAVTHLVMPRWAARYVFKFFGVVFVIEAVWLAVGYFA
jgi:hypothetical protein